jgi:pyruvate dehydrogenase phosphatase
MDQQESLDALVNGIPLETHSWIRPKYLFTPPYLTASPDIFSRKIKKSDAFIILSTGKFNYNSDGLFDTFDNNDCVRHVAEWLESPIRIDENAATWLIRKAIQNGENQSHLSRLLTISPGISRQYRDDITVQIIFLNDFYTKTIKCKM